jgi:hypothetical protein
MCILFACFLLAAPLSLTSCSGGPSVPSKDTDTAAVPTVDTTGAAPEETEPAETADPAAVPDLPADLDFGGEAFTLLCGSLSASRIAPDPEQTGELMNDAWYDTCVNTMEKLNVSLHQETQVYSSAAAFIRQMINAGDDTLDAVDMLDRESLSCARTGCFLTLQTVPHLDLSKKYWGEGLSERLSIGGVNYFASGSFDLTMYMNLSGVVFNNAVAEDNHVTIPYDEVDAGTWTMDKLAQYQGIGTADMDGDGVNDHWTYGSDVRSLQMTILVAAGYRMVDKDADGTLFLNVYENTNTFVDIMYWIQDTFYEGDMRDDVSDITVGHFVADKEMIHIMRFMFFDVLREMESDFSILPMPKWDESQQEYHSRSFDTGFISVPITAKDTALSGAVLEMLSYCGYRYLVPAYIENQLGARLARDPHTSRNIMLIYDTRMIDLGEAFLFDKFSDMRMYEMIQRSNIASFLASSKIPTENALAKIVADLASLG